MDNKNLPIITRKYPSKYRKHRHKLIDKLKSNQTEFF